MTNAREGADTMRVATYIRISTDEENQPYSLEAQELRLDAYIKSQDGWVLERGYSDRMTGSKLDRPGLQSALRDARLGRYDLLLVYRVDRLARSVRGLAQILEDLDIARVSFRSATEPFDTSTAAGRMMVQMLGVFAEFERATIIDRVVAGMERKAARGGWNGGSIPFGYELDRTAGVLRLREDQAHLVPVIFDLYAKKRWGAHTIARHLNDEGHRANSGKAWSYRSVINVLRNESYLGRIHFRGHYHRAAHPRLVDDKLFEDAAALLTERGEDPGRRRSNPSDYLLAGVVKCQRCGSRYVGAAAHGRGGRYRYYVCSARAKRGQHGCDGESLPAAALEEALIASLVETLRRTDLIGEALGKAAAARAKAAGSLKARLGGVDAEVASTKKALERYFAAFESGRLSEPTAAPRIETLNAKLRELEETRRRLIDEADEVGPEPPTEADLAHLVAELPKLLTEADSRLTKAIVQQLVAEVAVESRSSIQPTFRVPQRGVRILDGVVDPRGFEPLAS